MCKHYHVSLLYSLRKALSLFVHRSFYHGHGHGLRFSLLSGHQSSSCWTQRPRPGLTKHETFGQVGQSPGFRSACLSQTWLRRHSAVTEKNRHVHGHSWRSQSRVKSSRLMGIRSPRDSAMRNKALTVTRWRDDKRQPDIAKVTRYDGVPCIKALNLGDYLAQIRTFGTEYKTFKAFLFVHIGSHFPSMWLAMSFSIIVSIACTNSLSSRFLN
jgi:hypothetical protein